MSETHAGALHILKKHAGSRRPSSWRADAITQSKEEAIQQIGMLSADIFVLYWDCECAELFGCLSFAITRLYDTI